jgi:hypothetical protein
VCVQQGVDFRSKLVVFATFLLQERFPLSVRLDFDRREKEGFIAGL